MNKFVNPNANLNSINLSLTDNVTTSVNNIAPSVDGLSERPNQHNVDETPAWAPLYNNVTFEAVLHTSKGLIPRQRSSSREAVYAKYGWLGMTDSFQFSHFFRFRSE